MRVDGAHMGSQLRQLDHLDDLLHELDQKVTEIHALVEEHRPLLARAAALAAPGSAMAKFLKGGKRG